MNRADDAPGARPAAATRATRAPRHTPSRSRGWLALAGVLAGAAGVVLSQAAATALRADSSPVAGRGAAVRDFTPGPIAVFLVHLVGSPRQAAAARRHDARRARRSAAYAASWMRRFPLVPDLVFFVLAVLGLLAVLRLPNPGIGAAARR